MKFYLLYNSIRKKQKLSSIYFELSICYTHVRINSKWINSEFTIESKISNGVLRWHFVIIFGGNLRPFKWKKFLWKYIICRHFNPATIIDTPSLRGRGWVFTIFSKNNVGQIFPKKMEGLVRELFWKNEGF